MPPTCGVTFSISKKQLSITSAQPLIHVSYVITNEIKTTKNTTNILKGGGRYTMDVVNVKVTLMAVLSKVKDLRL